MDWSQVLAIVAANIALLLAMFGSIVAIWLHQDKKLDEYRKNADDDRREIVGLMRSIQEEIKDFHFKILAIERSHKP